MMKFGRWLAMAAMSVVVIGCGSDKNPSENIEFDSGVVVTIADQTGNSFNTGLFMDGGENVTRSSETVTLTKWTEYPSSVEDETYTNLTAAISSQYINNLLETITYDHNDTADEPLTYGYNFRITTTNESDPALWDFSEMVQWCVDLKTDLQLPEAEDGLAFTDDEMKAVGFVLDADITYEVPDELVAVDDLDLDTNIAAIHGCPLVTIATTWIGRSMENVQDKVWDVYTEYKNYNNYLDCLEGDDPDSCVEVDSVLTPTVSVLLTEIFEDQEIAVIEELSGTDPVTVNLVVDLTINEFEASSSFTIPIQIETVDFTTL